MCDTSNLLIIIHLKSNVEHGCVSVVTVISGDSCNSKFIFQISCHLYKFLSANVADSSFTYIHKSCQ